MVIVEKTIHEKFESHSVSVQFLVFRSSQDPGSGGVTHALYKKTTAKIFGFHKTLQMNY